MVFVSTSTPVRSLCVDAFGVFRTVVLLSSFTLVNICTVSIVSPCVPRATGWCFDTLYFGVAKVSEWTHARVTTSTVGAQGSSSTLVPGSLCALVDINTASLVQMVSTFT